jgi:hypothetical protein
LGVFSGIIQACGDEIENRGFKIISEMRRVLDGSKIDDFGELGEVLRSLYMGQIDALAKFADVELGVYKGQYREHPRPNVTDRVAEIKGIHLPEIDLLCAQLKDSQATRFSFNPGEVFAGNRVARQIFESAKQSIDIIDPYLGPEVLDMLEVTAPSVQIRLLTDKLANPTLGAYRAFSTQFGRVELRRVAPQQLHDRYIIVDNQTAIHLGHSVKDLGKRMSEIQSIPPGPVIQSFYSFWASATPVPDSSGAVWIISRRLVVTPLWWKSSDHFRAEHEGETGGFRDSHASTDLLAFAEYGPDGRNCRDQPD